MRHAIALATLTAALLTGCFYSPVGPNKAANPAPTPGADGKVAVSYTLPEGTEATKVTFVVVDAEGNPTSVTALDDSTNATRTGSLDVSSLAAGVHVVDVKFDEAEEAAAHLVIVKPGNPVSNGEGGETPAAGGETPAEGAETPAEETTEASTSEEG
jgi:hypothetical protein